MNICVKDDLATNLVAKIQSIRILFRLFTPNQLRELSKEKPESLL